MTYDAKVIAGGKIVIPADQRREFGIKDGDTLILDKDESGRLSTSTTRSRRGGCGRRRERSARRWAIAPALRWGSVMVCPSSPATGAWPESIPPSASTRA